MPEGHSIHRIAQVFTAELVGKQVRASSPQGRFAQGAAWLDGRELSDAWAWGKHLFLDFGPRSVHVHLGIYGSWKFSGGSFIGAPRRIGEDDEPQVSELVTENTRLLLTWDGAAAALSGPAACELLEADEVKAILDRLGPDPIQADDDGRMRRDFIATMRASSAPIGPLVMDQKKVAGPGNIYRAECLFRVGISPARAAKNISEKRLGALWDDLVKVMRLGVSEGRIITRRDDEGDMGEPRFWVYKRQGQPCLRCGAKVRLEPVAGRKLYWCGSCQN